MALEIKDLSGLNPTSMRDQPLVSDQTDLQDLWNADAAPLSIAGKRCSQGGHTMAAEGRMLITHTMSSGVAVDPGDYDAARPYAPIATPPNVTAQAGATWSRVHHAANLYGLAPAVHQSSAHFSVGGALSVNCHGRDPSQGPIASTVNWIEVWTPAFGLLRATRLDHPDLFAAALGGYGGCGVILRANVRLVPNLMLQTVAYTHSLEVYGRHLKALAQREAATLNVGLHYGWLKCTSLESLFEKVLIVDYKDDGGPQASVGQPLLEDGWGDTELLRAGWAAARQGYGGLRDDIWQLARDQIDYRNTTDSRLNWLRATVGFTAHSGTTHTDLLQEYFVPVDRMVEMVGKLRALFQANAVNVLSGTIRLVRQDDTSNLAYSADQDMVCIAVDVHVPLADDGSGPTAQVRQWAMQAMALALDCGGTYYLPYFGFADLPTFQRGYSQVRRDAQVAAMNKYNPQRRFTNRFLATYLP